jgi:hypothetical protein
VDLIEWHDFYRGRGAKAQYMGSVQTPYSPLELLVDTGFLNGGIGDGVAEPGALGVRWERTVRVLLNSNDTGVSTWPHEYRTSAESDWSWHMEPTCLFVYRRGTPYLSLSPLAKRPSTTAFPVVTR